MLQMVCDDTFGTIAVPGRQALAEPVATFDRD